MPKLGQRHYFRTPRQASWISWLPVTVTEFLLQVINDDLIIFYPPFAYYNYDTFTVPSMHTIEHQLKRLVMILFKHFTIRGSQ